MIATWRFFTTDDGAVNQVIVTILLSLWAGTGPVR